MDRYEKIKQKNRCKEIHMVCASILIYILVNKNGNWNNIGQFKN